MKMLMKGSYILIIRLPKERMIEVGGLQNIHFPRGHYAYVGSAMGGFKPRLSHHSRRDKRPRWHIDYLLQKAHINDIILCEAEERTECIIARALSFQFDSIPGFGCSDCKCGSHLFYAADEEQMKLVVTAIVNLLTVQCR